MGPNRRRMTTSCTACRKARIGCDATKKIYLGEACSNCERRGKCCSSQSEWIDRNGHDSGPSREAAVEPLEQEAWPLEDAAAAAAVVEHAGKSSALSVSPGRSLEHTACRRQQALTLHGMLWDIFVSVHESRYALWVGSSCCPYVETSTEPKQFLTRLAIALDSYQEEGRLLGQNGYSLRRDQNHNNARLEETLLTAVYAYSIRWLPIRRAVQRPSEAANERARASEQEARSVLWHRAHQAVHTVLTRPSYRSIFTLTLFSNTPVPPDHDDAAVVHLCEDVALSHFLHLRSRPRIRSSHLENQMPEKMRDDVWEDRARPDLFDDKMLRRQHMEDTFFWLGVLGDTRRSLMRCTTSLLLPGQSGDQKVWDFVRQRTEILDKSFRSLHGSSIPLSGDVIEIILQHASACKSMYWWTITRLFDALFHHSVEEPISVAINRVVSEFRRFQYVFGPLFDLCARDFMVINQRSQLSYFLVIIHYSLGSLVLADTLEQSGRSEVLAEITEAAMSRLGSVRDIVNALSLVLQVDSHSPHDNTSFGKSLLLLDPIPETMVDALLRTGSSLLRLYGTGDLHLMATQTMLSVVFTALHILSQISDSASSALSELQRASAGAGGLKKAVPCRGFFNCAAAAAAVDMTDDGMSLLTRCSAAFVDESVEEICMQARVDEDFVSDTVARYECMRCE